MSENIKTSINELSVVVSAVSGMTVSGNVRFKVMRDIDRLKKKLAEEVQYIQSVQLEIVDKYNGHIDDGSVSFDNDNDMGLYYLEWNKFASDEFEFDFPQIDLSEIADDISFGGLYDTEILGKFIKFD